MFRRTGDSVLRALDSGVAHGYKLRNVPFRISRLQAVKAVVDTRARLADTAHFKTTPSRSQELRSC
jgi:hypothetical protein